VHSIEGLRGAAIVTCAGRVKLEVASGLADAEAGAKCTPRTRFQIASVSKQFAAVAAMLLAESGKLGLAEPVARWLPGSPPQWQQVTLHHLLTHTAGVRHWGDAPGFDASEPVDLAERLALIQQAPLLTGPGIRWHYSSPGYLLAGHIVEQASGQPYAGFLTKGGPGPAGAGLNQRGWRPCGCGCRAWLPRRPAGDALAAQRDARHRRYLFHRG
jgi:CubicO group peptidase (beta-lactamase class C family)